MIFNILNSTTELWMTKYIIGEIFSYGGATLYKNHTDQTVFDVIMLNNYIYFALYLNFFREHCDPTKSHFNCCSRS